MPKLIIILSFFVIIIYLLSIPKIETISSEAQQAITNLNAQNNFQALKMYKLKHGNFPTQIEGLNVLEIEKVITNSITDFWGRPFIYTVSGNQYSIISFGADGQRGGSNLNKDLSFIWYYD